MSSHVVIGSWVIAFSFLLMAAIPPWRWTYALAFLGSIMHLVAVIGYHNTRLNMFLDLGGVLLMCVGGLWSLWNGFTQRKKRLLA